MNTTILKARNTMELGLMIEKIKETHEVTSVYYSINFIEYFLNLDAYCQAFMDSLDEKIKSLIIEMGLNFK